MHTTGDEARQLAAAVVVAAGKVPDRDVMIAPPYTALGAVRDVLAGSTVILGAQNVHWEEKGAYTGEISGPMLKELGCAMAIVGHSERRHVFGETDEETGRKVRALLQGGLTPLLCVGEKIEQRESGETIEVVERQLAALDGLDGAVLRQVVIAYEPVWAIGTGKTATPADAAEVHGAIRRWFAGRGVASQDISILYGGSVKPENARSLVSEPEIDGVLVGGASLDPAAWAAIASAAVD